MMTVYSSPSTPRSSTETLLGGFPSPPSKAISRTNTPSPLPLDQAESEQIVGRPSEEQVERCVIVEHLIDQCVHDIDEYMTSHDATASESEPVDGETPVPRGRKALNLALGKDSPTDPWKSVFFTTVTPPLEGSTGEHSELQKEAHYSKERRDYFEKEVVPAEEPVTSCRITEVGTLDFPEFVPDEEEEEEEEEEVVVVPQANSRCSSRSSHRNPPGTFNVPRGSYYVPDKNGTVSLTQLPAYPPVEEYPANPHPPPTRSLPSPPPSPPRDPLSISRESMRQKWTESPGLSMKLARVPSPTPERLLRQRKSKTAPLRAPTPPLQQPPRRPTEPMNTRTITQEFALRRKAIENAVSRPPPPSYSLVPKPLRWM